MVAYISFPLEDNIYEGLRLKSGKLEISGANEAKPPSNPILTKGAHG